MKLFKKKVEKPTKKKAVKQPVKKKVAIQKVEEKSSALAVTSKVIDDYLFGSGTTLTGAQKQLFKQTAMAMQLNPFKREVYAVPFKNNKTGKIEMSVMTGYEVYLKRADATGKLDGWKTWTEGAIKDGTLKALIKIHRKDFKTPFEHEVYFKEYDQKRKLWISKPLTMIKKVAMAQGFRLAFPETLANMPYVDAEITNKNGDDEPVNVTPQDGCTEEQKEIIEKIKTACSILGIDGKQCLEKFKLADKTFRDLPVMNLESIHEKLGEEIDAKDKKDE